MLTTEKEKYFWKTPSTLSFFFALLCFPGLITPIHGDEAVTYLEHINSTLFQLLFEYSHPNQHSLFIILSNGLMKIFGEQEIVFRFPVLLSSILSIFFIYYLGQIFWNRMVGTIASALLVGSYHHLYWAQHARGYAFTELFAITLILGITLIINKKPNKGAWVLILSGLALCLTLPSNAYFLPGCAIATFVVLWRLEKTEGPVFWFAIGKKIFPFLFLMVLTLSYFFIIYDDLLRAIESYKSFLNQAQSIHSTDATLPQFYGVMLDLVRPWGPWFYIPVLYGVWTLKRTQRNFFLILLGTPALVVVLSEIMGPPRSYVYMVPFLILLAALGIERGIFFLSCSRASHFRKILIATLCIMFLIPSVLNYNRIYQATTKVKYATMSESRKVLSYLQNKITKHEMLVIPVDDMSLRRNLEPLVAKQMLRVFKNGQLDKITLISHQGSKGSYLYPRDTISPSSLPDSFIRLIADFGKVRVHRMNVQVMPLLPLEADMDFSKRWGKFRNPKISKDEPRDHKFLGQRSLKINKNIQEDVIVGSSFKNHISSKDRSFLLYGYAGKYRQKSKAGLMVKSKQPAFSINQMFGIYEESRDGLIWKWIHPFIFLLPQVVNEEYFKWQIIFMMFPLNAGLNEIQESIFLREDVSHFDGFQSYLLTPLPEKE